ncbi:hypothetical protein [Kribbella solani]|uniref:hypothetical protein n=1 Tax=Kribbella solani TaxID=236067 RepID=UPI0029A8CD18|nr:hypothetical protein [Kribbella solani]MDX2973023.1 hypothetical protein [Kribbella solani]
MTDLKELLDDAAGPEPAVSTDDLTADLARGHRAVRRRRIAGLAGGALATALVAGVGWSVLSGATTSSPAPAVKPTVSPTTSATPTTGVKSSLEHPVPPSRQQDPRPIAPMPAQPVRLVKNTTAFPGPITCTLIPEGWAVRTRGSAQELYDPKLKNPSPYRDLTYTMLLQSTELTPGPGGGRIDRVPGIPWHQVAMERAGKNRAAIFAIKDSSGAGLPSEADVYVQQGATDRLIVVSNYAQPLGWRTYPTLLQFADSCHYK